MMHVFQHNFVQILILVECVSKWHSKPLKQLKRNSVNNIAREGAIDGLMRRAHQLGASINA
jgi:quinol-cytochrome oxidoreductase complex cytochrome b subunit